MKKCTYTTLFALALLPGLALAVGQTTRVSVDSNSVQGNSGSLNPSISADGRYVAFVSDADNLVTGDTNGIWDVFVRDRQTGKTTRVSVDSAGAQAYDGTFVNYRVSISADGRYVAFASHADNLVAGDTNGTSDGFVHDRLTGQTERISINSAGGQGNNDSVAFSISADGRYVAFSSLADNLITGDTNGVEDIFVRDRQTGKTERVSVDSTGGQGNGNSSYDAFISADGRYVAFNSHASNLVAGDSNGANDIFVRDRQTGKTERVSVDSSGGQSKGDSYYPSISADGRYVAFSSYASNLVAGDTNGDLDVFVHDRQTGKTTRVSVDSADRQGNGYSVGGSISADGRYVAFSSYTSNLVSGDTNGTFDGFVHDRLTGKTTRLSVNSAGGQGNGESGGGPISADGRYVTVVSYADNLVAKDTNGTGDVFVRDSVLQPQNQADVSLALSGPASAAKGSDALYTFTVTNNGSFNAAGTTLIGVISSQGKLKSIVANQGKCSRAAVPVCRLGILTPGQSVTVTATVTLNGQTTINATAHAVPKDGKRGNNAKSIATKLQ